MTKNHTHKPPTEKVTAISLPSDGVAAETRSRSIRRASEGKVSKRGAVVEGGRLPAFVFSIPLLLLPFFCRASYEFVTNGRSQGNLGIHNFPSRPA